MPRAITPMPRLGGPVVRPVSVPVLAQTTPAVAVVVRPRQPVEVRPLSAVERKARRDKRVAALDRRIDALVEGPHGSANLSAPEIAQLRRFTERRSRQRS